MKKISRHSFVRAGAAAGAAAALDAVSPSPVTAQPRNTGEPFRVGCLNVIAYSHLNGLWGPLINPREGQKDTPFTGMCITHCWDINYEDAVDFGKRFGCTPVRNFDDMLGKVDGVISGGYYEHPWNHIIHEPYLEAGLPNLINRPFANSLAKANRMIELAKKHNATILVPSSHEHNEAIARAKAWAAGKKITCYNATNSFDDYPTHGVHGVYMICRAIAEAGYPVESVSYRAKNWYSPPGILTYEHTAPDGGHFYGTLHQVTGTWGTVRIYTPEEYGGKSFDIHRGEGYPFNKTQIWAPTVWAFQNMALHGDMPQTFDQLYHKTEVFLAGWKSILEHGGNAMKLSDIPVDWESPVILPNHPDHTTAQQFKKMFG